MSLCETCVHARVIRARNGSRFLLCELARSDPRFAKYPLQPVELCAGYQPRSPA